MSQGASTDAGNDLFASMNTLTGIPQLSLAGYAYILLDTQEWRKGVVNPLITLSGKCFQEETELGILASCFEGGC